MIIPVVEAGRQDWNPDSFWHYPWGRSGVHKGIDIFADKGTSVVAAQSGIVIYSGVNGDGGNVVATLGPLLRIQYYAHLDTFFISIGNYCDRGDTIGLVGNTGNAINTPPHLHYSIVTVVPYIWRWSDDPQGWKKMFYLDPDEML